MKSFNWHCHKVSKAHFSHFLRGVLICYFFLCLIPRPTLSQEGYQVVAVKFAGNHSFSSARLSGYLILTAKRGLQKFKFWQKPMLFHESRLQTDVHALIRFYQREGFIQVRISPDLSRDPKMKNLTITYQISEGPAVVIQSVQYQLVGEESNPIFLRQILDKIKPKLQSRREIRFRDEMIQEDLQKITAAYSNEGYAYAQVKIRPELADDKKSVVLTFEIVLGPICRFGKVSVLGDSTLPTRLIQKQVSFRQGQKYRQELLQNTQRQIYQLGFFQFVTVKAMLDTSQQNVLPVAIHVQRARRLTVKTGVGYSREDQVRVFVDIRRLAFLGGARRLEFYAKHSKLEPYRVDVKLYQAAFPHPRASMSVNPFYLRQQEPGFSVDRTGAHFTLQQRFGLFTDSYLNYSLEQDHLRASAATRASALDSSKISLYHKSSINLGFAHDDSKPLFYPQSGQFIALNFSLTGIGFRSDFHYIKMILESRKYWHVNGRFILAARYKIGSIQPIYNDRFTPIEDRFYAGGSLSLRGWPYAQIGPKDRTGKPIGGNSILEMNCEWRYPFMDPLSGVFFIDAGNVWSRVHGHRLDQLNVCGGWGLRFRTPIGPIRLDLAWPIGQGKNPMQIHLSVGQAF